MKFGQLIECNMRYTFLEKSWTKSGEETSPRPFSEKLKLSIYMDQYLFSPPKAGFSKGVANMGGGSSKFDGCGLKSKPGGSIGRA